MLELRQNGARARQLERRTPGHVRLKKVPSCAQDLASETRPLRAESQRVTHPVGQGEATGEQGNNEATALLKKPLARLLKLNDPGSL